MTGSSLRPALDVATDVLQSLGLRYALIGGIAVGVWAPARGTEDVDLYADLPDHLRPTILRELERRDFDVPAMAEELERFGMFRSLFKPTDVFVDIFDAQNPLGEAILDRRRQMDAEGKVRWIASPEDLALLKVFSDRTRDFEDLAKLIAVGKTTLDMPYIEQWVRELDRSIGGDDVSERLRRAKEDATRRIRPKR